MAPEAKVLVFYALSLGALSAVFCWLNHRLSHRERE